MDHYEFLGIDKDAEQKDIKQAFRQKSKSMHPDVGGDEAEFAKLTEAYQTLSDPSKRDFYDRTGRDQKNSLDLDSEAENFLLQLFDSVIEDGFREDGETILDALFQQCRGRIKSREKDLQFITRTKEGYEEKIGFIEKEGDEENIFDRVLRDKVQRSEEEISLAQVDIQVIERSLILLKGFHPKPREEKKKATQGLLEGYASALLGTRNEYIDDIPALEDVDADIAALENGKPVGPSRNHYGARR